jgi:hypothetical protein
MHRFRSVAVALALLAAPAVAFAQTPAIGSAPATTTTQRAATAPAPSPATTGQFTTEAAAKGHCPADTVVWVNTSSKAYHMSGDKYYGKTKKGAYMCQKEADAGGFHMGGKRSASAASSTSSTAKKP